MGVVRAIRMDAMSADTDRLMRADTIRFDSDLFIGRNLVRSFRRLVVLTLCFQT